ncbi:hypothetical protein Hanom_Chr11g01033741 [Helianthus anomalus]
MEDNPSTVVDTPKVARNFMAQALPPSHRFMNFELDPKIFDDQYSMSICEGFFRGAGMLQRNVEALLEQKEIIWRDEKERLLADVKYYKEAASISAAGIEILYADLGIA